MTGLCTTASVGGTKGAKCDKLAGLPSAIIFANKGEKLPITLTDGNVDSIAAGLATLVAAKKAMVLTGIKTNVPVDTAATSQTLGDYTMYNDDEAVGITVGVVKTSCQNKALKAVEGSGFNACYILTKNGVLLYKDLIFDGTNASITPLDVQTITSSFANGVFADGSDLAANLTLMFGRAKNLVAARKISVTDEAEDLPQASAYHVDAYKVTATSIAVVLTDCNGDAVVDADLAAVGNFTVNGVAPTAAAAGYVAGVYVYTLTVASMTAGSAQNVRFEVAADMIFGANVAKFVA